MKSTLFGILQRIGRSFMLPIALLPVAGLLLGIGASFTNQTTIHSYGLESVLGNGTLLHALLTVMKSAGSVVFSNLPVMFAIGVAMGMAKKKKKWPLFPVRLDFSLCTPPLMPCWTSTDY